MIYTDAVPTSTHQLTVSPFTPMRRCRSARARPYSHSHSHSHSRSHPRSHCRRYGTVPHAPLPPLPALATSAPCRLLTHLQPALGILCQQDATTAATTAVEVTTTAATTVAVTRWSAPKDRYAAQRKRRLRAPRRRKKVWKRRARWRERTQGPSGDTEPPSRQLPFNQQEHRFADRAPNME